MTSSINNYTNTNTTPKNNITLKEQSKKLSSHNKSFSINSEKSKYSIDSHIQQQPKIIKRNTNQKELIKNRLNKSHNSMQLANYSQKRTSNIKKKIQEKEFLLQDLSMLHSLNTSTNVIGKKSANKIKPIISYMTTTTTKLTRQKSSNTFIKNKSKQLNKSKSKELYNIPIFFKKIKNFLLMLILFNSLLFKSLFVDEV